MNKKKGAGLAAVARTGTRRRIVGSAETVSIKRGGGISFNQLDLFGFGLKSPCSRYGGPGRLKKACIKRLCVVISQMISTELAPEEKQVER